MKAAVLAIALLACCALPGQAREMLQAEAPAEAPAGGDNIAAVAEAAGLTDLLEAAKLAGVTASLTDPTATLTVFAPTNEAFEKLFAARKTDLATLSQSQFPTLKEIVLNHVVQGAFTAAELDAAKSKSSLASPPNSILNFAGNVISILFGAPDIPPATITEADVPAGQSIIHVINEVLVPPTSA